MPSGPTKSWVAQPRLGLSVTVGSRLDPWELCLRLCLVDQPTRTSVIVESPLDPWDYCLSLHVADSTFDAALDLGFVWSYSARLESVTVGSRLEPWELPPKLALSEFRTPYPFIDIDIKLQHQELVR
jgi:hypothetical protein